ncbi:MAG TPA: lycopene cyclase domain-containing protein [Actinomycetes bacterium]|nr:lycopene cyclase domain-containing protein [Actinomycetes bacterium]
MTYTSTALLGVVVSVLLDLVVLRTRLLTRKSFWTAYGIIVVFQLISNGVLTGFSIVQYDGTEILGSDDVVFVGDGRLAFAPVEDLLFGFALVTQSLAWWVWWGRRGVQYEPVAGPPRWRGTDESGSSAS